MAFAGKCDKKENITAAVAANIWMSNEKSAKSAFQDEGLQYIVMDCEVSSMYTCTAGRFYSNVYMASVCALYSLTCKSCEDH